jgi:hypothetical protein
MYTLVAAGFGAFIGAVFMMTLLAVAYFVLLAFGLRAPEKLLAELFWGDFLPYTLLYFGAVGGFVFGKQHRE